MSNSALVIDTFKPSRGKELALTKGEIITIQDRRPSGWWLGVNETEDQFNPTDDSQALASITK